MLQGSVAHSTLGVRCIPDFFAFITLHQSKFNTHATWTKERRYMSLPRVRIILNTKKGLKLHLLLQLQEKGF